MKIGLVDVDGHNFPNLPLMKLSAFHKKQGDTVEWAMPICPVGYDRVYMSKVFTFTPDDNSPYEGAEIIKGGTGYGIENKLPTEIENLCPDYSLYSKFSEAYGFLTRGCPRNCPFCIVTQKEGAISKQVADLSCFAQKQKTIKLLDPNILACKDRENLLQQLIDSRGHYRSYNLYHRNGCICYIWSFVGAVRLRLSNERPAPAFLKISFVSGGRESKFLLT